MFSVLNSGGIFVSLLDCLLLLNISFKTTLLKFNRFKTTINQIPPKLLSVSILSLSCLSKGLYRVYQRSSLNYVTSALPLSEKKKQDNRVVLPKIWHNLLINFGGIFVSMFIIFLFINKVRACFCSLDTRLLIWVIFYSVLVRPMFAAELKCRKNTEVRLIFWWKTFWGRS